VIVRALSFIEDRNVLEAETTTHNPAIDWRRFAKAVAENAAAALDDDRRAPGGSTLATQLEKMRHSPDGVTSGATDKLRQIAGASLRAYREGEDTRAARRQIIVDYLNSLPLGAVAGEGEVIGLAQGLAAWYGADFDAVNAALARPAADAATGLALKQVVSLIIAQRHPSRFLNGDRSGLGELTDAYLPRWPPICASISPRRASPITASSSSRGRTRCARGSRRSSASTASTTSTASISRSRARSTPRSRAG
jgi:membrane peptidoglycan carboxypeptidase